MSAEEKAKDLVSKFIDLTRNFHPEEGWVKDLDSAKHCALIVLDELEEAANRGYDYDAAYELKFFAEVREGINKL